MAKTKTITCRIPEDIYSKFNDICKANLQKPSQAIKELIRLRALLQIQLPTDSREVQQMIDNGRDTF